MDTSPSRIDIHHHILPPEYIKSLTKINITTISNLNFPTWDLSESLRMMEQQDITAAITSISSPGVYFGD